MDTPTEPPAVIDCHGDVWLSAKLAMEALREMGLRQQTIYPRNEDEWRQRNEGAREYRDLDCVKQAR